MGVVDDAVEDGIGQGWIADQVVPAIDRNLAGDQRRAAAVAVLDNLEEIPALLRTERFEAPVARRSGWLRGGDQDVICRYAWG